MIETPRAALLADRIAGPAEFFSFGTNDLTQMTMALSRDDAGRFLPDYTDQNRSGIFQYDPFQSLDVDGVGQLVQLAIEKGRSTRRNLKIGICGEHGGESRSVTFCHHVGMDYVSCSPYRVPIARLAAAQAAVAPADRPARRTKRSARKTKKVSARKTKRSAPRKTTRASAKRTKTARRPAKRTTARRGKKSGRFRKRGR
jgi:pyruvate,orthophosphate dikinase